MISRGNEQGIAPIDQRLDELQSELLTLASTKIDCEQVGDGIYRLREEKRNVLLQCANGDEIRKQIDDMSVFLRDNPRR